MFSNKLLITSATRKMKDYPRLLAFLHYSLKEVESGSHWKRGGGGVVNQVMKQDPLS
jgi:hypothetical protein